MDIKNVTNMDIKNVTKNDKNMNWNEKYRPSNLEKIISLICFYMDRLEQVKPQQ